MIIFKRKTHQHRLILGVVHHLGVGAVTSSKQVRRHLNNFCKLMIHISCARYLPPFPQVQLTRPLRVDGVPLVRVDHHAEEAGVSLRFR